MWPLTTVQEGSLAEGGQSSGPSACPAWGLVTLPGEFLLTCQVWRTLREAEELCCLLLFVDFSRFFQPSRLHLQKCVQTEMSSSASKCYSLAAVAQVGRLKGPAKEEGGKPLGELAELLPGLSLVLHHLWYMGTHHLYMGAQRGHIAIKKQNPRHQGWRGRPVSRVLAMLTACCANIRS